jgi:hypothetical protein
MDLLARVGVGFEELLRVFSFTKWWVRLRKVWAFVCSHKCKTTSSSKRPPLALVLAFSDQKSLTPASTRISFTGEETKSSLAGLGDASGWHRDGSVQVQADVAAGSGSLRRKTGGEKAPRRASAPTMAQTRKKVQRMMNLIVLETFAK